MYLEKEGAEGWGREPKKKHEKGWNRGKVEEVDRVGCWLLGSSGGGGGSSGVV